MGLGSLGVIESLLWSVSRISKDTFSEFIDFAGGSRLVEGRVRLVRTDRGILAKGVFHTQVEIDCSRCLASFSCPLTLNIEEEYFPTIDVVSGAQLAVPTDVGSFIIDEHHILDLTEAVRQYALLVIPMKPLCREDCAGLCPQCGHNLNMGPCTCPTEEIEPR